MSWLLNIVYLALLLVASPWLVYAAVRKRKYREGFAEKLLGRVPRREGDRPCVWLHAVSVGEVNLLGPVIARLQTERPELEIVVSTTTRTGIELARKKYAGQAGIGVSAVFYCPLDFSWAVGRAMRRIRPTLLVLAELELWPNLIAAAKRHGAQVAVINGRLSEKSHRGYRRLGPLVRRLLQRIDLIAAQNEAYAERFVDLGAQRDRVQVTGSVKFDGAETDRENPRTATLRSLAGFSPDDHIFLAGSTQAPEEELALQTFQNLRSPHPALRLVLVPRHPERFDEVARLLDDSGVAWQRRSELEHSGTIPGTRILLVDCVGELGAWWGTAEIGFVGGSMGSRGGQNMIEPAAYGAAVCFGPNTKNFRDVVTMLLSTEAAHVVADQRELEQFVRRCLDEPHEAAAMGRRARALVRDQVGAVDRTVAALDPLLSAANRPHRRAA